MSFLACCVLRRLRLWFLGWFLRLMWRLRWFFGWGRIVGQWIRRLWRVFWLRLRFGVGFLFRRVVVVWRLKRLLTRSDQRDRDDDPQQQGGPSEQRTHVVPPVARP